MKNLFSRYFHGTVTSERAKIFLSGIYLLYLAHASRGKKNKKKPHPVVSNADLFYDPHLDGEDQAWVDSQRRQRSMPSSQPRSDVRDDNKDEDHKGKKSSKNQSSKDGNEEEGMQTDAVLNCPCCMISICDDCQR